jgi:hypothetical protein
LLRVAFHHFGNLFTMLELDFKNLLEHQYRREQVFYTHKQNDVMVIFTVL